jgi:hypothetical protein
MSDFTIKALTPETFDDFAALVERSKGMFASCWCAHFHPECAEKGQSAEGNRALKHPLVADGIAHTPCGAGCWAAPRVIRARPRRRLGRRRRPAPRRSPFGS